MKNKKINLIYPKYQKYLNRLIYCIISIACIHCTVKQHCIYCKTANKIFQNQKLFENSYWGVDITFEDTIYIVDEKHYLNHCHIKFIRNRSTHRINNYQIFPDTLWGRVYPFTPVFETDYVIDTLNKTYYPSDTLCGTMIGLKKIPIKYLSQDIVLHDKKFIESKKVYFSLENITQRNDTINVRMIRKPPYIIYEFIFIYKKHKLELIKENILR